MKYIVTGKYGNGDDYMDYVYHTTELTGLLDELSFAWYPNGGDDAVDLNTIKIETEDEGV